MNSTELYERALADPASDIAEFLPIFRDVAMRDDVTKIIELGVREGHSTAAFLAGLEGHGHLWSVDCEQQHDEAFADVEHWTFVLGDDNDPAVWAQLPEQCDVAFIDTDHAYTHTVRELSLLAQRASRRCDPVARHRERAPRGSRRAHPAAAPVPGEGSLEDVRPAVPVGSEAGRTRLGTRLAE